MAVATVRRRAGRTRGAVARGAAKRDGARARAVRRAASRRERVGVREVIGLMVRRWVCGSGWWSVYWRGGKGERLVRVGECLVPPVLPQG